MSGADTDVSQERKWAGRPVLAFFVRSAVYVVPIAASVLASVWLSKVIPAPESVWHVIGWWVAIIAGSTSVLFLVDKGVRRLLPLAALLQMTMIFPDKSPSRFRTALRSGASIKHLTAQLRAAEEAGLDDDPTRAAEIVLQLSSALNAHDPRTRGHSERVRAYSEMLAEEMGVSEEDRAKLRWASLLHDIGKLKVSPDILNKPGKLDDDEWVEIKNHPTYGAEICGPLIDWLGPWSSAIVEHHERFDGFGYPAGFAGLEIALGGRVVAVADAYDVMTTARSYKKPMPAGAAREELARHAGAQFDPDVVRAFLSLSMGRLRWVAGPLSWLAQLPFLRFAGGIQSVGTTVGVAAAATTGAAAALAGGLVSVPGVDALPLPPPPLALVEYVDTPVTTLPAVSTPVVVAGADVRPATEDAPATFGVLGNDVFLPGSALGILIPPGHGEATVNDDLTITYVPDDDFAGVDTFTYQITGPNGDTASATVTVEVGEVNDLPEANDDAATVDEDDSVIVDVLANDTDTEGLDPSSVTVGSGPVSGTVTIDPVTGVVTYTPDTDFAGSDAFIYTVADTDGVLVTATVTITVTPINDPPVAVNDSASTDEEVTALIAVLGNDSDIEGGLVPGSVTMSVSPSNGTTTVSGGAVSYTPDPDFNGVDSFGYQVCDDAAACDTATVTVNPINDPPIVPGPGPLATDEDVPISFDPLAAASDVDGDALTVSTFDATTTAGGTVVLGSLEYHPPADWSGDDSFTYTVTDGTDSVVIAVTITVNPVNDPPAGTPPALAGTEDTPIILDPLVGFTDAEGDPISLDSLDAVSAAGGTLTYAAGLITYTPADDHNGTDTFTYILTDGTDTTTIPVTITLTPTNDTPVAVDDAYSTAEEAALVVAIPGVVLNDSDVDLDSLDTSVVTPPTDGTLVLGLDGSFTYTPDLDFEAVDSFTYLLDDGALTDTATVTITVTPVNDAPVANDDAFDVLEDSSTGVTFNVLINDTDVDLTDYLAVPSYDDSTIADGTLTHLGGSTFKYVPDGDFDLSESFVYTVRDLVGATDTATVTITVIADPDDPIAMNDTGVITEDSVAPVVVTTMSNDTANPDTGDSITFNSYDDSGLVGGTVVHLGGGVFEYTPYPDFFGTDTFTYDVIDTTARLDGAKVTITVTGTPDNPSAVNDSYVAIENTTLTIGAPGVLRNDFDVDGDPVAISAIITLPTDGSLSYLNADGSFQYVPSPTFVGDDVFQYQITDGTGRFSVGKVSITVNSGVKGEILYLRDTGPTFVEHDLSTTPSPFITPVPTYSDGLPGWTIRKSGRDPAETNFTKFALWTLRPATALELNGPVSLNLWSSAAGFAPNDDVHIRAVLSDCADDWSDCATVLSDTDVHVNEWNSGSGSWVLRSIDMGSVTHTVVPGRMLALKVLVGHNDLWVVLTDSPPAGASTLTVTVANAPPIANDDGPYNLSEDDPLTNLDVVGNDTDLNPVYPVTITLPPTKGTATPKADGTVDYTPTADEDGEDSFTYELCDTGALCDAAVVTINLAPVNDTPLLAAIGPKATDELVLLTFSAAATDPKDTPADNLTFLLSGAPAGASIHPTTGVFTFTPTEPQGPTAYAFDVIVTDDGSPNLNDVETIVVTVNEVNVAPVLDPVGDKIISETALLSFTATASDADLPANTLAFSLSGTVPAGATINPTTGAFTWTPTESQGGSGYTFNMVVTDDGTPNLNASEMITVTVTDTNVAPTLDPVGNKVVNEGVLLSFAATASDSDLPADKLTFSLSGGPPAGAGITPGGLFTWTPSEAQGPGSYVFNVVVADDGSPVLNDSELITVTVNELNSAPVLGAVGDKSVNEGVLLSFSATATDPADTPANGLTYSLSGAPVGAAINLTTGAFTWTPTEAQGPGSYGFSIVVTDDGTPSLADSEAITVTVNEVNVAPVVTNPGDQANIVGSPITMSISATDADVPANSLTYSDGGTLPAGLSINPSTGAIAGTPSLPAIHFVTITVTDNETPVLNGSAAFTWFVHPDPVGGSVLISEWRTTGPAGATDEFVELYNPGGVPVVIENWELWFYNSAGARDAVIVIDDDGGPPTTISPFSRYLLVSSGFTGGTAGDQAPFPDDLSNNGGLVLADNVGNAVDAVGRAHPGTPLPQMAGPNDQSFERYETGTFGNCVDTNVDVSDFFHNLIVTNPQNTLAAPNPCALTVPPVLPSAGHIVISEVRSRGPAGGTDEFVELFNPTPLPVPLAGWELRNGAGGLLYAFTFEVLASGQHMLVAGPGYGGPSDGPLLLAIGDGGSQVLTDASTAIVDRVSFIPVYSFEGPPLPEFSSGAYQHSYERIGGNCYDTDVNGFDFVHNLSFITPRTMLDALTVCP